MLRHPFFGIVVPEESSGGRPHALNAAAPAPAAAGRRTFLAQVAALAAGASSLLFGRTSRGQEPPVERSSPGPGTASSGEGRYTTQALGEEGSGYPQPGQPSYPPPGTVTTYAVGEEAGWYRRPSYPSYPPTGMVTKYAVGEEAGWGGWGRRGYYRPRRYSYRPPTYYYYRY